MTDNLVGLGVVIGRVVADRFTKPEVQYVHLPPIDSQVDQLNHHAHNFPSAAALRVVTVLFILGGRLFE